MSDSTPFSTHILDSVLEKKRIRKEKLRLKVISKIKYALNELFQEVQFKEAYIFGSVTKPNRFSEDSDIDIGFLGLKENDFFKALSILSRKLDSSVDIIQLEDYKYRNGIEKIGIKWKKKDYS